jgi:omega-6 fatty acid desaturase (delta-12 desaturase)
MNRDRLGPLDSEVELVVLPARIPRHDTSGQPSSQPGPREEAVAGQVDHSRDSCLPLLSKYRGSNWRRSIMQLCTSLTGFVLAWLLAWWCLDVSYFLTLIAAVPAAGFLVRLFILAHDCGHGSFFPSRRANEVVGCALGVLTLTPYHRWRKHHAIHHASSGDLDRRGCGDVHMLTVKEYVQLSPFRRWIYRVHRHPLVLFGIGPLLYFVIWQRLTMEPRLWKKERRSVWLTNAALLVCATALAWLLGLGPFLAVHTAVVALASSAGVWLFFVQHHFPTTYWRRNEQWDYAAAGLEGSSYYHLPAFLQWLTADIGIHHIHHLDSRIPNYRLRACFDENPILQRVHRLTIRESLDCVRLLLWDEETRQMVAIPRNLGSL